MTMQSSNLLPALRELPGGESSQNRSFRETITGIVSMDRAMYAAEFASAVSGGMWGIFDSVNVDDRLLAAYESRWPPMSKEISLHDKVREMTESGEFADPGKWLYNGLKGKLAEFEAKDWLDSNGFTELSFPPTEVNQVWDISAISPDGEPVHISVKTGAINEDTGIAEYARKVIKEMDAHGTIDFMVGEEVYATIERLRPDLVERIIADVGPDHELVQGITDGLATLTGNLGIDVPDSMVEIIPYASAIFASARLIAGAIKTEKEFKAVDRTTKNKIQVVQTLTLISKFGPKTLMSIIGGKGGVEIGGIVGTLAGTVVPGVGNAVGGAIGSVGGGIVGVGSGMWIGRYLGKRLEPHMLNLALNITNLTNDDLFYYKNKVRIDDVALSFNERARALAAPA